MERSSFNAYREKIVARKCLNALVDIHLGLLRQNKLLEILLEEMRASTPSDAIEPPTAMFKLLEK